VLLPIIAADDVARSPTHTHTAMTRIGLAIFERAPGGHADVGDTRGADVTRRGLTRRAGPADDEVDATGRHVQIAFNLSINQSVKCFN